MQEQQQQQVRLQVQREQLRGQGHSWEVVPAFWAKLEQQLREQQVSVQPVVALVRLAELHPSALSEDVPASWVVVLRPQPVQAEEQWVQPRQRQEQARHRRLRSWADGPASLATAHRERRRVQGRVQPGWE